MSDKLGDGSMLFVYSLSNPTGLRRRTQPFAERLAIGYHLRG